MASNGSPSFLDNLEGKPAYTRQFDVSFLCKRMVISVWTTLSRHLNMHSQVMSCEPC